MDAEEGGSDGGGGAVNGGKTWGGTVSEYRVILKTLPFFALPILPFPLSSSKLSLSLFPLLVS